MLRLTMKFIRDYNIQLLFTYCVYGVFFLSLSLPPPPAPPPPSLGPQRHVISMGCFSNPLGWLTRPPLCPSHPSNLVPSPITSLHMGHGLPTPPSVSLTHSHVSFLPQCSLTPTESSGPAARCPPPGKPERLSASWL